MRSSPGWTRRCASAATWSISSNSSPSPRLFSADVKADRRVVEERQPVAELLDDLRLAYHAAGDEVPLVDDQHHRASRLVGVARDVRVLGGQALGGVEHEQRHLAALQALERHDHRELLERLGHAALAADARGVDRGRTDRSRNSSGVSTASRVVPGASCTSTRSCAEHGVDQRRLADVGPPDDGDARCRAAPARVTGAGARSRTASSSSATPRPCSAETGSTGSPKPRR